MAGPGISIDRAALSGHRRLADVPQPLGPPSRKAPRPRPRVRESDSSTGHPGLTRHGHGDQGAASARRTVRRRIRQSSEPAHPVG